MHVPRYFVQSRHAAIATPNPQLSPRTSYRATIHLPPHIGIRRIIKGPWMSTVSAAEVAVASQALSNLKAGRQISDDGRPIWQRSRSKYLLPPDLKQEMDKIDKMQLEEMKKMRKSRAGKVNLKDGTRLYPIPVPRAWHTALRPWKSVFSLYLNVFRWEKGATGFEGAYFKESKVLNIGLLTKEPLPSLPGISTCSQDPTSGKCPDGTISFIPHKAPLRLSGAGVARIGRFHQTLCWNQCKTPDVRLVWKGLQLESFPYLFVPLSEREEEGEEHQWDIHWDALELHSLCDKTDSYLSLHSQSSLKDLPPPLLEDLLYVGNSDHFGGSFGKRYRVLRKIPGTSPRDPIKEIAQRRDLPLELKPDQNDLLRAKLQGLDIDRLEQIISSSADPQVLKYLVHFHPKDIVRLKPELLTYQHLYRLIDINLESMQPMLVMQFIEKRPGASFGIRLGPSHIVCDPARGPKMFRLTFPELLRPLGITSSHQAAMEIVSRLVQLVQAFVRADDFLQDFGLPITLEQAIHCLSSQGTIFGDHQEKLELVGDAALNLLQSMEVVAQHPHDHTGILEQRVKLAFRNRFLKLVGYNAALEEYLFWKAPSGRTLEETCQRGEARQSVPESAIANVLEALLGATFMNTRSLKEVLRAMQALKFPTSFPHWEGLIYALQRIFEPTSYGVLEDHQHVTMHADLELEEQDIDLQIPRDMLSVRNGLSCRLKALSCADADERKCQEPFEGRGEPDGENKKDTLALANGGKHKKTTDQVRVIEESIGYRFIAPHPILDEAFMHASVLDSPYLPQDRLAFLGEEVFRLLTTLVIMELAPSIRNDQISHARQCLLGFLSLACGRKKLDRFLEADHPGLAEAREAMEDEMVAFHLQTGTPIFAKDEARADLQVKLELSLEQEASSIFQSNWNLRSIVGGPKYLTTLPQALMAAVAIDASFHMPSLINVFRSFLGPFVMPLMEKCNGGVTELRSPLANVHETLWKAGCRQGYRTQVRVVDDMFPYYHIDVLVHGHLVGQGEGLNMAIAKSRAGLQALNKVAGKDRRWLLCQLGCDCPEARKKKGS